MEDNVVGTVSLNEASKLVFTINNWKGQQYAHVRKFVNTAKYKGFTKSG